MNIPINKDFDNDYKETIWKGFSLYELVHLLIGTAVSVALCLILWLAVKLPVIAAIYLSIPIGFPVIAAGFWKSVNGLNLKAHRRAVRYRKDTAVLFQEMGEYTPVPEGFYEVDKKIRKLRKQKISRMKKDRKKDWRHCRKKK